ncbi:MAG: transporter substrate-binding domain-containing protein, partial [Kangiellaceae bacterium]|nr:transporter substrate-binding domain-containing protein [Kangiellaceae bacterium]
EPSYFESFSKLLLTTEEQQWLSENKSFLLGIDNHWEPFEYIDSNGKYAGISSEYVELVAEMLSVALVPELGNSWAEVIGKIKKRELDILPAVGLSEERKSFLSFSRPYIEFTNVVVAQKNNPFVLNMAGLKGKTMAVVKGFNIGLTLQRDFPDIRLVLVENINAGLDLIESGDVYGYVDNVAVISHNININNRTSLEVVFHTPYMDKLTFGVRKGLEPLVPIINKALNNITEKQRNEIVNRWLSVQVNVGTDVLTMLQWGLPIFLLLASVIALVMRSNSRMQKEIIRRRETEASLEQAKLSAEAAQKAAEKANQGKNQFLANISHEIRTPMNAIIGSTHLIEQSGINEEQKSYLDILKLSANTLLTLINDTLDWSKIEAGKIDLENQVISLHDLVSDIIKQAELSLYHTIESADKSKLVISSKIDQKVPTRILGDRLRLSQILLNLLNNAIKFTEKGSIAVELFIEYKKMDKLCMHFVVSDTGIGMTLSQTEKLFKTYSQADASTSRKYGGTGLGLSICKKLCQLMQGHIWVESKIDVGSQFHFTCMLGVVGEKKSAIKQSKPTAVDSLSSLSQDKDSKIDELLSEKEASK